MYNQKCEECISNPMTCLYCSIALEEDSIGKIIKEFDEQI